MAWDGDPFPSTSASSKAERFVAEPGQNLHERGSSTKGVKGWGICMLFAQLSPYDTTFDKFGLSKP